jgi:ribose transport system ATP-binding protein
MRIDLRGMSKSYAGVPALRDVSLCLEGGRIHALMGENGAGKSTLIKLLAGVTPADAMTVRIDGRPIPLTNPAEAQAAGFRFIHQELNIVPQVSVAENILLGHPMPRRLGLFVDWPAVADRAQGALSRLGADHIDPRAPAGALSAGDKMLVKIAAALVAAAEEAPARLYVLDEPTAALTGAESEMLFSVLARLKARGAAILYVSHRMDEVMRLCETVTVLRDGAHVMTVPTAETRKADVIAAMTGRDVADAYPPRQGAIGTAEVARLDAVASPRLVGLDVVLHEGEILGIAGLADAGQGEALRLFLGLEPVTAGTARLAGAPLPAHPAQAWARGVAYVPRERRAEGLMLPMGIRANIVLPHLGDYGPLARPGAERRDAEAQGRAVRLKRGGIDQPVGELSGGNQQKVVFARALHGRPRLLLLDEPTRGVDVGAKFDIYRLVRDLSAQGCAVIVTSSDLPELLGMCDRVLVLQDGRQTALVPAAGLSQAGLLTLFYLPEEAA